MGNNVEMVNGIETRIEKREMDGLNFLEYEAWLEKMECEGWNLRAMTFGGEHTFVKGKARKIRYCIDTTRNFNDEYIDMFKEFGWKLVFRNYTDFLWAMEYEGERPEAFDKFEVLQDRNKKYIRSIIREGIICLCTLILILNLNAFSGINPLFIVGYIAIFMVAHYFYNKKDIAKIKTYNKNKKLINQYLEARVE